MWHSAKIVHKECLLFTKSHSDIQIKKNEMGWGM